MAFTLRRDSRLARWAFWFDSKFTEDNFDTRLLGEDYIVTYRGRVPKQVSLCNLFWRVFFWAPLLVLIPTLLVCGLLFGLILFCIHDPKTVLLSLSIVAAIAFVVWLMVAFATRSGTWKSKFQSTLLYQGAAAVKGKFCPIIKFTSGPEARPDENNDLDEIPLTAAEEHELFGGEV